MLASIQRFQRSRVGCARRTIGRSTRHQGWFPHQESAPPPPPPPVTIGIVAENRLMMLDGGFKNQLADMVRTPDGAIGWLRIGGRLLRRKQYLRTLKEIHDEFIADTESL